MQGLLNRLILYRSSLSNYLSSGLAWLLAGRRESGEIFKKRVRVLSFCHHSFLYLKSAAASLIGGKNINVSLEQ